MGNIYSQKLKMMQMEEENKGSQSHREDQWAKKKIKSTMEHDRSTIETR
jgi:hypothetical protein